ncbi:DUF716 domain-containing protein [Cephalotus follicularis]|uniref:DUF716 domain-containing protein n=1 Tax=Cephalotus follicularis TaxID=3775 RepID=A0A1Q3C3N0_CEPFO|nr:DUF716 domain-containing protein [Cephalotus follicularis]
MGLFVHMIAGGAFILTGAWQSLTSSNPNHNHNHNHNQDSTTPSSPLNQITTTTTTVSKTQNDHSPSSLYFIATSIFSFLFIINSVYSIFDAINSRDGVGSVLQFQVLAVAALFMLYSVSGLLICRVTSFPLPRLILELLALFAFVEEFLLFYLQRKDTSGIENHYFDLLLVPILICIISTILELKSSSSRSSFAKLARGLGLILQGTWFLQMGFSFYTNLIVHGCTLHQKSRGNYTVRCKGHSDYHRGRAIATLQFNCHLALLVVLSVGLYSIVAKRNGYRGDFASYRPLGTEMQQLENVGHFTLDSDEDGDYGIKDEDNVGTQMLAAVELVVNGRGSRE